MDATWDKTAQIIRDILKMPDLELTDNSSSNSIPEWDSLNHVMIVDQIEKTFEIKFSLDDMLSIDNMGNLVQLIQSKI